MFKTHIFAILFALIVLLGSILRLYNLSNFPVGFHIDEASLGYNAYSLLLTGKDENGNRFPLYIDTFGDQRPSGYHYLAILPVKIFGLTEFATRLPGALFGILSIIAIFLLTNSIFQNKKISLLSSFLLAISPWHVVLSRASAETVVALFFILIGFYLIIKGLRSRSSLIFLGAFSLILSFFFYHTPRVFVPLLFTVFGLLFYNSVKKNKKYLKKFVLSILFVGFVSFILVFVIKGGTGRFSQVNIFTSPGTKLIMEEEIREDGISKVSPLITRISHNKVIDYSKTFIGNYFDYFSGRYLFIEGGLPIWYKIPGMGLLYIVEFPFILLGLFYLFKSNNLYSKFIPVWIAIAPITAAITVDDIPNIQRSIVLFPMLEIAAAYGLYIFLERVRFSRYFVLASLFIFAFNFYYFTHQYFVNAKVHRTWYRNNGYSQMMDEVKKNYDSYDRVIMTKTTGGSYPLVLFYMKYDPVIYQAEGSPKDREYKGFGKFIFVPQDCPSQNRDIRFPKSRKTIFVDRGDCQNISSQDYKTILREDGTPAYKVVYENL